MSVGLSDGPADEGAFLKPTSVRTVQQTRTVTFSLAGDGSDSPWLSCVYEGTAATVTRRLPKAVKECRVVYREGSTPPSQAPQVSCQ